MNVGMMWFDNNPQTGLEAKVCLAADYYLQKYGLRPDLCLVHPSMLEGKPSLVDGPAGKVTLRPNRAILPGHLWIGKEESINIP
jgi:hypothetical protein